MVSRTFQFLLLLMCAALLAGCGGTPVVEVPSVTPLRQVESRTFTPVPSLTKAPPTAPPVPTATPTPKPTHTPIPTATPTSTPSATPTPKPSPSPTHTPSATLTLTPTTTHTAQPDTPTPTVSPISAPPTETPTPELVPGWVRFQRNDDRARFSIDLAPGWDYVDTSPEVVEANIQAFCERNAPMAHWEITGVNNLGKGGWALLLAYDVAPEATAWGLTTYLVVSKEMAEPGASLNEMVSIAIQQVEENNQWVMPESMVHQRVTLGSIEAEEIQYVDDLPNSGQYLSLDYLVPTSGSVYRLWFSSRSELLEHNLPVFRQMAQTFRPL